MSRLYGFPDSSWPILSDVLLNLSDDKVVRQKLEQHITAALASGGGSRAHAMLMLNTWAKAIGSLPARAQQLLSVNSTRGSAENYAIDVMMGKTSTLQIKNGPKLRSYLRPFVPRLEDDDDRAALTKLINSLPNLITSHITGSEPADPSLVVADKHRRPVSLSDLSEGLGRPRVAEAFSELVHNVRDADWHVAVYLREAARVWYLRRNAVDSLTKPQ
jgi:hypothetical protein